MSSKEHLIETIQATYCAKSSEEVREAERNVFASLRDNKVLAMLGKMLETHNDHKLKQSISSLILRHVLNINARLDLEPLWLVDCFNKLKDIVNNFHISAVYKRPFCTALCLLIKKVSTSSIDQLITNTIYYYSIH